MTEKKNEYLKMLDILSRCVGAVAGKKRPPELAWQVDAEVLATKFFFHLGSSFQLQEGTHLPKINGVTPRYFDFPSISTITRAALETYLCFQYIFIQPTSIEEKSFRHDIWELGGFLDRQRFMVTTAEGKEKLQQEKKIIEKLREKISTNPLFKLLPDKRKKEALKGKWRLDKSWLAIAESSGTHKEYFISIYAYLSSFAHSDYLGILQLSQAKEIKVQERLSEFYTSLGLTLMSHFIVSYCDCFEETKDFLESQENLNNFVQTYFVTAEEWQRLIDRA